MLSTYPIQTLNFHISLTSAVLSFLHRTVMFPNCNWISLSPHSEQHWLPISEYFQNAFNLKVWEINCHFWYVLQIWRTHTHTAHDFLLNLWKNKGVANIFSRSFQELHFQRSHFTSSNKNNLLYLSRHALASRLKDGVAGALSFSWLASGVLLFLFFSAVVLQV